MKLATLTAQAIDKAEEDAQEDGQRAHLGASVIGRPCARQIFYGWRWTLREKFPAQKLRLFNSGHTMEARVFAYLRSIPGVELWEFDPRLPLKNGKPQQFRVSDHEGHFGGSLDAVARGIPDLPPGALCAVSVKTHNEKSFTKLKETGVMGSKWEHFIQEQMYIHKMREESAPDMEWALYIAINKNDDHLHAELLHHDQEMATNGLKRAADIIYANEPPPRIANSPGHFHCKFCHLQRLCHFGDITPDRNCRTCRFSRVAAKGLWYCGLREVELDVPAQKAGCGGYQVHPKLTGPQP